MKHKLLGIILIFACMLCIFGCSAEPLQANEDVWVIAEELSYDENDEVTSRNVYTYKDRYNYRIERYSGDRLTSYTDMTQSKDGTQKTDKTYNEERLISTTEYEYDKNGKALSYTLTHDHGSTKRERHWSTDGKTVEVLDNGVYLWTEEYDEQGREIRSYGENYETVYTYADGEKILRTSYTNNTSVEYVVHKYDAQGREIETLNYTLDEDRTYTEDDIVARTVFEYDADGHSYRISFSMDAGETQIKGSQRIIYKPLSELLKNSETNK